ncbi:MAG: choice-of-anchor Q domain-containing protein, partial [Anaerolineales bacterium]
SSEKVITLANSIFYRNDLDETHTNPVTTEWQGYHTNRSLENGGGNLQYPRTKEPDFDNEVNNLITSPTSAILFADPLLNALTDNGGHNQTMALQPGSPAIDAGNESACTALDQRDYTRVGTCDIGAYEYGGAPFTPTDFVYLPLVLR